MAAGGQSKVISSVRPSPQLRLLINAGLTGLWLSGGAWLICRYFLRISGEWGPEPNPAEPWWMRLHGAFGLLIVWAFGLLWGQHIISAWATGRRRVSGGLLFSWLVAMILTAYLLVWGTDDGLFAIVSPIHWGLGLAAPAVYLAHRFMRRKGRP